MRTNHHPTLTVKATAIACAMRFVSLADPAVADVIVKYEMGQTGPHTEAFVIGGNLTAGANATIDVNAGPASPNNFPNAPVLNLDPNTGSSSTSHALDNGRLFYFDLTVATDMTLSLSRFSLDGARNGTSSRRWGAGFQVNTGNGFGSRTDFVSNVNLSQTRPNIESFGPYDLSAFTVLQDLQAGDVVRFLVAEDNEFSASFDNIQIDGTGGRRNKAGTTFVLR